MMNEYSFIFLNSVILPPFNLPLANRSAANDVTPESMSRPETLNLPLATCFAANDVTSESMSRPETLNLPLATCSAANDVTSESMSQPDVINLWDWVYFARFRNLSENITGDIVKNEVRF